MLILPCISVFQIQRPAADPATEGGGESEGHEASTATSSSVASPPAAKRPAMPSNFVFRPSPLQQATQGFVLRQSSLKSPSSGFGW